MKDMNVAIEIQCWLIARVNSNIDWVVRTS